MTILLVDDEELQLLRLVNSCKKVLPDAELVSFSNPVKAFEEAKENKIDVAFLDIEMPGLNGIQLAKKLKKLNPLTKIIFVTAYNEYALEAFKVHASGYITKPVNESKIKEEIDELGKKIELKQSNKLQIKCFGNFEVFCNGEPLKFSYKKSKEAFAYLVDREGSAINVNELNAVLWEEDHPSYLRNLIADIQNTLNKAGFPDVFIKRHNECYIDTSKVDCDAYEYKKGNPDAIRMYRGEYMMQYSWPIFDADY
ncbi:MAG: response regulator [Bacilli bacterium]|nr:response regulator [Bacilli bacterium]